MIVTRPHLEKALHGLQEAAIKDGWKKDGMSLPPGCGVLCDLLGAMWWSGDQLAQVKDDGDVGQTLKKILGAEFGGASEAEQEAALQAQAAPLSASLVHCVPPERQGL